MNVIGITGYRGAGKSTTAGFMARHGYVEYALSEPIKEGLQAMFDLPDEAFADRDLKEAPLADIDASPRFLAQTLGTEWGRRIVADDLWLRAMVRRMRPLMREGHGVVVSDVRFDNEARWIREQGGRVIRVRSPATEARMARERRWRRTRWLLHRSGVALALWLVARIDVPAPVHASELGVSDDLVDAEIANDGTLADLDERAAHAVRTVQRWAADSDYVPAMGRL